MYIQNTDTCGFDGIMDAINQGAGVWVDDLTFLSVALGVSVQSLCLSMVAVINVALNSKGFAAPMSSLVRADTPSSDVTVTYKSIIAASKSPTLDELHKLNSLDLRLSSSWPGHSLAKEQTIPVLLIGDTRFEVSTLVVVATFKDDANVSVIVFVQDVSGTVGATAINVHVPPTLSATDADDATYRSQFVTSVADRLNASANPFAAIATCAALIPLLAMNRISDDNVSSLTADRVATASLLSTLATAMNLITTAATHDTISGPSIDDGTLSLMAGGLGTLGSNVALIDGGAAYSLLDATSALLAAAVPAVSSGGYGAGLPSDAAAALGTALLACTSMATSERSLFNGVRLLQPISSSRSLRAAALAAFRGYGAAVLRGSLAGDGPVSITLGGTSSHGCSNDTIAQLAVSITMQRVSLTVVSSTLATVTLQQPMLACPTVANNDSNPYEPHAWMAVELPRAAPRVVSDSFVDVQVMQWAGGIASSPRWPLTLGSTVAYRAAESAGSPGNATMAASGNLGVMPIAHSELRDELPDHGLDALVVSANVNTRIGGTILRNTSTTQVIALPRLESSVAQLQRRSPPSNIVPLICPPRDAINGSIVTGGGIVVRIINVTYSAVVLQDEPITVSFAGRLQPPILFSGDNSGTVSVTNSGRDFAQLSQPVFDIIVDCGTGLQTRWQSVRCGPGYYGKTLDYVCPPLLYVPVCGTFDEESTSWTVNSCVVVSSTASTVTCACAGLADGILISAHFAVLSDMSSTRSVFVEAESVSVPAASAAWQPYAAMLSIAVVLCIASTYKAASVLDAHSNDMFVKTLARDPEIRLLRRLTQAERRLHSERLQISRRDALLDAEPGDSKGNCSIDGSDVIDGSAAPCQTRYLRDELASNMIFCLQELYDYPVVDHCDCVGFSRVADAPAICAGVRTGHDAAHFGDDCELPVLSSLHAAVAAALEGAAVGMRPATTQDGRRRNSLDALTSPRAASMLAAALSSTHQHATVLNVRGEHRSVPMRAMSTASMLHANFIPLLTSRHPDLLRSQASICHSRHSPSPQLHYSQSTVKCWLASSGNLLAYLYGPSSLLGVLALFHPEHPRIFRVAVLSSSALGGLAAATVATVAFGGARGVLTGSALTAAGLTTAAIVALLSALLGMMSRAAGRAAYISRYPLLHAELERRKEVGMALRRVGVVAAASALGLAPVAALALVSLPGSVQATALAVENGHDGSDTLWPSVDGDANDNAMHDRRSKTLSDDDLSSQLSISATTIKLAVSALQTRCRNYSGTDIQGKHRRASTLWAALVAACTIVSLPSLYYVVMFSLYEPPGVALLFVMIAFVSVPFSILQFTLTALCSLLIRLRRKGNCISSDVALVGRIERILIPAAAAASCTMLSADTSSFAFNLDGWIHHGDDSQCDDCAAGDCAHSKMRDCLVRNRLLAVQYLHVVSHAMHFAEDAVGICRKVSCDCAVAKAATTHHLALATSTRRLVPTNLHVLPTAHEVWATARANSGCDHGDHKLVLAMTGSAAHSNRRHSQWGMHENDPSTTRNTEIDTRVDGRTHTAAQWRESRGRGSGGTVRSADKRRVSIIKSATPSVMTALVPPLRGHGILSTTIAAVPTMAVAAAAATLFQRVVIAQRGVPAAHACDDAAVRRQALTTRALSAAVAAQSPSANALADAALFRASNYPGEAPPLASAAIGSAVRERLALDAAEATLFSSSSTPPRAAALLATSLQHARRVGLPACATSSLSGLPGTASEGQLDVDLLPLDTPVSLDVGLARQAGQRLMKPNAMHQPAVQRTHRRFSRGRRVADIVADHMGSSPIANALEELFPHPLFLGGDEPIARLLPPLQSPLRVSQLLLQYRDTAPTHARQGQPLQEALILPYRGHSKSKAVPSTGFIGGMTTTHRSGYAASVAAGSQAATVRMRAAVFSVPRTAAMISHPLVGGMAPMLVPGASRGGWRADADTQTPFSNSGAMPPSSSSSPPKHARGVTRDDMSVSVTTTTGATASRRWSVQGVPPQQSWPLIGDRGASGPQPSFIAPPRPGVAQHPRSWISPAPPTL